MTGNPSFRDEKAAIGDTHVSSERRKKKKKKRRGWVLFDRNKFELQFHTEENNCENG